MSYQFEHISREPVIPIAHSFNEDFVRCLIDGVKKTNLTIHLKNRYGMTPEDYRAHFGLPVDHPVVCGSRIMGRHQDHPVYQTVVARVGSRRRGAKKANATVVAEKCERKTA